MARSSTSTVRDFLPLGYIYLGSAISLLESEDTGGVGMCAVSLALLLFLTNQNAPDFSGGIFDYLLIRPMKHCIWVPHPRRVVCGYGGRKHDFKRYF